MHSFILMKKITSKLPFFIIVLVLLIGCSEEKPEKLEIEVIKEFVLGDKAQEQLHHMHTNVISSTIDDELAFSNTSSPVNVIITDENGQFIEKIGEEGRGPDEIQDARYKGFDDEGNIVVLDKQSAFFKYFNRTTEEVFSYEYPIKEGVVVTTRNLEMCGENWYLGIQLLGESTLTTVPIIGEFDSKFNLVDKFGGYDPFFKGRADIMNETVTSVDCSNDIVYTSHGKVPYIQAFSIKSKQLVGNTDRIPSSFMLSNKFVTMVTNSNTITKYLSEEQSLSLYLGQDDSYIYHVFRNEKGEFNQRKVLNDSDHYVAVYNKEDLSYVDETKLPGAVLGFTKEGTLIVLKDENEMRFQIISVIKK